MNASSARRSTGQIDQHHERRWRRALDDVRGGLKQRRAIDARGVLERLVDTLEQVREVRSSARRAQQLPRIHAGESKLLQRARERPRKTGRRRHRREVLQRPLSRGVERRSRCDRFGAQPRARRMPLHRERDHRAARSELRQADSLQTEGRRHAGGDVARQIVSGTA